MDIAAEVEVMFFAIRNTLVILQVPRGALVVVSGAAGSGKSTLLAGIMGDPRLLAGKVSVHGSLALVSQQPWLESGTIRYTMVVFGTAKASLSNMQKYRTMQWK